MDKLEMAIELIERARKEKQRLTEYEREVELVNEEYANAQSEIYWDARRNVDLNFYPLPCKALVNDSLKMARRFLKEEYV